MTRVFPLPAPANTSRGPSTCSTASRWRGVSPSRKSMNTAILAWGVFLALVCTTTGGFLLTYTSLLLQFSRRGFFSQGLLPPGGLGRQDLDHPFGPF